MQEDTHVCTHECDEENDKHVMTPMNRVVLFLMSISWVPPVIHIFWHPIAHYFGLPCP